MTDAADAFKCSLMACKSGYSGRWEPTLNCYAEGHNQKTHKPASLIMMGLLFCDECAKTIKAHELIPQGDSWNKIKVVFFQMGYAQPDYDSMFLTFAPPRQMKLGNA